jgi:hypothetical protein
MWTATNNVATSVPGTNVVAGFSPRSNMLDVAFSQHRTRAKARDYIAVITTETTN